MNEAKEFKGKMWVVFYKDHCEFKVGPNSEPPTALVIIVAIGYVDYEDSEVIRVIFEGDDQGEMVGCLILKSAIKAMVEIKPTPNGKKIMKAMKVDLFGGKKESG